MCALVSLWCVSDSLADRPFRDLPHTFLIRSKCKAVIPLSTDSYAVYELPEQQIHKTVFNSDLTTFFFFTEISFLSKVYLIINK